MSSQKKILIFDNDPDILNVCKYILNKMGLESDSREKCDNIIEVMEHVKPDLVLMDNWIPGIGGFEATRTIKNHPEFKKIPVIYFSAHNDIQTLAIKAGADGFISKPFDLADFEMKILTTLFKWD